MTQPFLKLGEKITWFPGHMYRATKLIRENISKIDLFFEVRDARVPISSRNYELDEIIKEYNKPKLIILNKYDVCNRTITGKLVEHLTKAKFDIMPVSAQQGFNINKAIEFAKKNNSVPSSSQRPSRTAPRSRLFSHFRSKTQIGFTFKNHRRTNEP